MLALAGQCGRLGAPARDRRLGAIRLAGATPRQAVALVVAETGLAATFGTALGLALFLLARVVLDRSEMPAPAALVALVVGLPLLATAVAAILLRRVAVTPFGVVRRERRGAPRPWPALLIAPALAAVVIFEPLGVSWAARPAGCCRCWAGCSGPPVSCSEPGGCRSPPAGCCTVTPAVRPHCSRAAG